VSGSKVPGRHQDPKLINFILEFKILDLRFLNIIFYIINIIIFIIIKNINIKNSIICVINIIIIKIINKFEKHYYQY